MAIFLVFYFSKAQGSDYLATRWSRFGTCSDFPIVLTAGLSYEHYSDTLVAATFGRGVYGESTLFYANASCCTLRPRTFVHSGIVGFFALVLPCPL